MRDFLSTIAISFVLAFLHAQAQEAQTIAARMDRAGSFYQNRDGFMGMVTVARDHQIIFQRGYGYANLESKIPFTADTRFRIGSLTKQFTAAAILLPVSYTHLDVYKRQGRTRGRRCGSCGRGRMTC